MSQEAETPPSSRIDLTFERNTTRATTDGPTYEINLACWLILKGLQMKREYYIGCNVKRFGNFDDVCFKYKYDGAWHLMLLQLKHKETTNLNDKFLYDDLLFKCYKSYMKIIKDVKANDIFEIDDKVNIHYIIFTNGRLPDVVELKCFNKKTINDYLAIDANKFASFQLEKGKCIVETFRDFVKGDISQRDANKSIFLKIFQKIYDNESLQDLKELITNATDHEIYKMLDKEEIQQHFNKTHFEGFLEKLIICHEQPNVRKLYKYINDEVVDMGEGDSERVCDDMIKRLTDWHKYSNEALSQSNLYDILDDYDEVPLKFQYLRKLNFNRQNFRPRNIYDSQNTINVTKNIFNPNEFESPLILVGDAGEGKTTIFNYWSQMSKPDVKIISLKLGKISKSFNASSYDTKHSMLKSFFEHSLNYKDKERYNKIMEYTKQDNFFLLLDGYDEAVFWGKKIEEKTNRLINMLSEKFNVLISTRKAHDGKLQKLINGNIYYIEQFKLDEQMLFAKYFFINNERLQHLQLNIYDEKLNRIINQIFELTQHEIFLAAPLQLEMLLDLFMDKFAHYYNNKEQICLDLKLNNLFGLYATFIEKKINMYLNRSLIAYCHEDLKNEQKNKIFSYHALLAKSLFNSYELYLFNEIASIFSMNENELIAIGFINYISECRNQVGFVHETFAEFFYAYHLIKNVENINHLENSMALVMFYMEMDVDTFMYKLLNSNFLYKSADKFKLLNDSIDDIKDLDKYQTDVLGRTPLHIAVMIGAEKAVNFLIQDKACINSRDLFGATPLHYAVQHNIFNIVAQLIQNEECDLTVITNRGETCFTYAINIEHIEIMHQLLEKKYDLINIQTKSLDTPLHIAIKMNEVQVAIELINTNRCDLSLVNEQGETCLHYAIRFKRIEIIHVLLTAKNCPLDTQTYDCKQTALHYAILQNLPELVVQSLLDANCDSNILDYKQENALHYAVKNKRLTYNPTCKILNNIQCDISLRNIDKKTCLHLAAEINNSSAISELSARADCPINFQFGDDEETPLCLAIRFNAIETVNAIINNKDYNLSIADCHGKTCLHYAIEFERIEIIKLILAAKNLPLNLPNNCGDSALHLAVKHNSEEMVELLLNLICNCNNNKNEINAKCSLSLKNIDGLTCLHIAAMQKNDKIINLLLKCKNCPINVQSDKDKETPLHYAIKFKALPLAITLIDSNRCDLSLANNEGETCLHLAVTNYFVTIIKLLLKQKLCPVNVLTRSKQTALHLAMKLNFTEIVKLLLKSGCDDLDASQETLKGDKMITCAKCDLDVTSYNNETYLHLAAQNGSRETIYLLLKRKDCPINVQTKSFDETALHYAIRSNAIEIAFALINSKRCNLKLANYDGQTCLHYAIIHGYTNIAKLLLTIENCPINMQTKLQNSALHDAVSKNLHEIVKILLDAGCNYKLKNNQGKTAYDLACELDHYKIKEIFKSSGCTN